ncbi:MAG: alpha/beta hydrolase family protein [Anaerolineaceae bacterium]
MHLAILLIIFFLFFSPAACNRKDDLPEPLIQRVSPTVTPIPTFTPTITPTPKFTTTPLPTITPTPNPYASYTMEALSVRSYGGGVIQTEGTLTSGGSFTRSVFKYRSEGLELYGFLNVPDGEGPFPVVVMLHGYIDPTEYSMLDYSTRYADALAKAGYIVLHPNLRGYGASDDAYDPVGVGDTIDTLNLLALIRTQAGTAGSLEKADGAHIGIWGHSMGGGIVLRVLEIDKEIDAAVLYSSINADEKINLEYFDTDDGRGNPAIQTTDEVLRSLSASTYLDRISTPLSIHHGEADKVVPLAWSDQLCTDLGILQKEVYCYFYENQPHTFQNSGDTLFIQRTIDFFDQKLH